MAEDITHTSNAEAAIRDEVLIKDALRQVSEAQKRAPKTPTQIAGYEIVGELGRGGMGVVFLAKQRNLDGLVAMKVMRPERMTPSRRRLFHYEAKYLSRLQHRGIARIFEAGMHKDGSDSMPYFVMEYVPAAKSLLKFAEAKKLSTRERLQLFTEICDAVNHGHQKGVIHRDLKPANILVDPAGQPKIIDFGVARATYADLALTTQRTDASQLTGTIPYMSPEQCAADPDDLDTRSDVYALGVVLYELLCGQLPYDVSSSTIKQATRSIIETPPRRLAKVNRKLRGDLDKLVLRTLEKDREQRYESASDLGNDIRRYLNNEALPWRLPNIPYQLRKFARRNIAALAAIAFIFIGSLSATVVSSIFWYQADSARERAERQRDSISLGAAESATRQFDITTAKQHLDDVLSEHRGWTWRHVQTHLDDSLEVLIPPTGVRTNAVAWTSDGRMIASGDDDGLVRLVSLSGKLMSSRRFCPQDAEGLIYDLAFRLDGLWLAVAGRVNEPDDQNMGRVEIWDVSDPYEPDLIASFQAHYGSVSAIAFHPKTPLLATASTYDESIMLWDLAELEEPRLLAMLPAHDWMVASVAFNSTGDLLASTSYDMTARVWNLSDPPDAHEVLTLRGHSDYVVDVAFHPNDDNVLATASIDGTIKLWDVAESMNEKKDRGEEATGVVIDTLRGHTAGLESIAFSRDGRLLASGGGDRSIRIWELNVDRRIWDVPERNRYWTVPWRRELIALRGHSKRIRSLAFGPEDQLVSASDDGTVRLWVTEPVEAVPTLLGHTSSVTSVAVGRTKAGIIVASGSGDFTVRLWDPDRCEGIATLIGHGQEVGAVAFNTTGNRLASGSRDKTVIIWDVTDPDHAGRIATLDGPSGHDGWVHSVAFDPLGERLALASKDGTVELWNLTRLEKSEPETLYAGAAPANVVRFNSSGTLIVTGHGDSKAAASSVDNNARIWIATTNELLEVLPHDSPVTAAAFSPDDQILVTGTHDGLLRIWDMADERTPSLRETLSGHAELIESVEFHPDTVLTRRFASCSGDRTIKMWEIADGGVIPIATLRGHIGGVRGLAFSPDGSFLASASGGFQGTDNSVKLWETEIDREVKIMRAKASAARREAEPIVEERFQQYVRTDEVVASLESDAELGVEIRDAAVRLARFRGDYPSSLLRDSWRVVKKKGATQEEYRQALERAVLARHNLDMSRPDRGLYLLTLGVAQYRVGTPEHLHKALEALKDAERALEQGAETNDPSLYLKRPAAAAVAAMVHWRLEQTDLAREALRRARDLIPGDLENYPDTDSVALLREAQALIEGSVRPIQE